MPSNHMSRLGRFGAGLWIRRVAVLVLAVIVVANLAVVTFAWSQHPRAGGGGMLAVIWILSIGAGFILLRLWRAPSPGAASSAAAPTNDTAPSSHRPDRP
jgi:hypothetical protein